MAKGESAQRRTWREREVAGEPKGVVLDPRREPVPDLQAYDTVYVPGHLVISGDPAAAEEALKGAAAKLGWDVEVEPLPSG
jgi:hypothetical protein